MENTCALLQMEIIATQRYDELHDGAPTTGRAPAMPGRAPAMPPSDVSSGVSVKINMPVGPNGQIGEDATADVQMLVATGSGAQALAEARGESTAAAPSAPLASLRKIAAAVTAKESSSEQKTVIVLGRRSGLGMTNTELRRLEKKEDISSVYPATQSSSAEVKLKVLSDMADEGRHFFLKKTSGIENAEVGSRLHDNQKPEINVSSAMFNGYGPANGMFSTSHGP